MSAVTGDLAEKISSVATRLAGYTALGSFLLYTFGYMSLRFHLSVMGITTDLDVLDERYFFHGAQFLVYLVPSLPSLILILAVLVAIPAALIFRGEAGARISTWVDEHVVRR